MFSVTAYLHIMLIIRHKRLISEALDLRSIYFAAKEQSKRGTSADIINIIRSRRLQTIICCKAAIYAIIPLNNKTIVLSYN